MLKKTKAITNSERVLQAYGKAAAAVQQEEWRLSALVVKRVESQAELDAAEYSQAIGEKADVDAAQSRLDVAKSEIRKSAGKLSVLRTRVAATATDLAAARGEVQSELPAHISTLKADFDLEWRAGVEVFAKLLGRRAAVEARVGKLDLKPPAAASSELPSEESDPWNAIVATEAAISQISGWDRQATLARLEETRSPKRYDVEEVYVSVSPHSGFPVGMMLVDASGAPGVIEFLFRIDYLETLKSKQWRESLSGAQAAELQVRADAGIQAERNARANDIPVILESQSPERRKASEISTGEQPSLYGRPISPRQPSAPAAPRRLN